MSSSALVRFGGLACLLSGGMRIAGVALHPEDSVEGLLHYQWIAAHVLLTTSFVFGLLGLVGLYLYGVERNSRFAFISFLIAFFGTALLAVAFAPDSFFLPAVAAVAPELLRPSLHASPLSTSAALLPLMVITLGGLGAYLLGHIVFGIAILRAAVLPRWAGFMLAVGVIGYLVGSFAGPMPTLIGAIAFGGAYAWLGVALWSGSSAAIRQPELTPVH